MATKGTPLYAVRKFCIECCGGVKKEVKTCCGDKPFLSGVKSCPLFKHRFGRGRISVLEIRKHCLRLCMNGSRDAVRDCSSTDCYLYPFRLGTNPNYKESTKKLKSKLAKKQQLSKIGLKSRANKKAKVK